MTTREDVKKILTELGPENAARMFIAICRGEEGTSRAWVMTIPKMSSFDADKSPIEDRHTGDPMAIDLHTAFIFEVNAATMKILDGAIPFHMWDKDGKPIPMHAHFEGLEEKEFDRAETFKYIIHLFAIRYGENGPPTAERPVHFC